jgi:hypothetical protein
MLPTLEAVMSDLDEFLATTDADRSPPIPC